MSDINTHDEPYIKFGKNQFRVSRLHHFGIVIEGLRLDGCHDYLHDILLSPGNRESFLSLIEDEGLVICKNVRTVNESYRKVRGKSSYGKLSQAEYYHHDGCSCPTKPRIVEIRMPYQDIARNVATAIARFSDVIRAMLIALPDGLSLEPEITELRVVAMREQMLNRRVSLGRPEPSDFPPADQWDKLQGRVTRLVRRELDAESCRAYFRRVDRIAGAYDLPWEMGESRLMANACDDLAFTVQHRRAYQKPREANEQNGSLVKRWTAEEA